MKTWITRALAVSASLAACFGFVTSSPAQVAGPIPRLSFSPATQTVNLVGSPGFVVLYKQSATTNPSFCSPQGEFRTQQIATESGTTLGVINREVVVRGSYPYSTEEKVTVPAGVVDAIKRQRITSPVYYTRRWADCTNGRGIAGTEVPITFVSFAVEAAPVAASVATESDTLVPVRWRATFGGGFVSRVESREGRFVDSQGRVYGSAVRELLQASGRSPLEFGENLRVPQSVVREVLAARGGSGIRYERTFMVNGLETTGTLPLNFAGRIAAPFAINHAELRFLDGSRFKTVALGEEVQLEADITFGGSGRLSGSWDVAGPTSTPGAAMFVRRELVDEYLSFGRRTLLRSPAIKAERQGVYIVRLSLTTPDLGTEGVLQLSFVVRGTGVAPEIVLVQPPPLSRLSPGLPFAWEAVGGASHYLLEFYDAPTAEGREPASGMILPAAESRVPLSPAARRRFQPGRSYWWRVVALGQDGALLGQSALRELLLP